MSLKPAELDRAWAKLGFTTIHSKRDVTAQLWIDGKVILWTKRSHGSGKLDGQIPTFIRQQMKLDKDQFRDAIACPLQKEGYLQILIEKGVVQTPPTTPPENRK